MSLSIFVTYASFSSNSFCQLLATVSLYWETTHECMWQAVSIKCEYLPSNSAWPTPTMMIDIGRLDAWNSTGVCKCYISLSKVLKKSFTNNSLSQSMNKQVHVSAHMGINSYSASHDNWCTATLWNRIMTVQCEGMGEVGSARYEPALLPPCPSIRALSCSNCQRSTHSNIRAWQFKC